MEEVHALGALVGHLGFQREWNLGNEFIVQQLLSFTTKEWMKMSMKLLMVAEWKSLNGGTS
jgi:hypothetical protein